MDYPKRKIFFHHISALKQTNTQNFQINNIRISS